MHELPDAQGFQVYRVVDGVTLDGVRYPQVRAVFYRREAGAGTETLGVYSCQGEELFAAWGYVGEEHCRFHAVKQGRGRWYEARPGCPAIRPLRAGDEVVGIRIQTPAGERAVRFPGAGGR